MAKSVHPLPELAAEVERLSAAGLTAAQTASLTGTAQRTIERHYGQSLARGRLNAVASIGESVYGKALAGDNACAFFYLKCQGHWREVSRVETTGPDGGPIAVAVAPPAGIMLVPVISAETWKTTVAEHQRQLTAKYGGPTHVG